MRLRLSRPSLTLALGASLAVGMAALPAHGDAPRSPAPRAPARANVGAHVAKKAAPVPASRAWHAAPPGKTAPTDATGKPVLVLQGLNIPDRVELTAASPRGGFSAEDLDRAAHVMREPSSGNEHPIDPRLLDTVYRLAVHFHAPEIRIISGYRTPRRSATSNHGKGRAMDLVVPGASDEEVAKFAREQGFTGVGVYPVSGFVHVDVRERSFFWVDTSGPGKRSRVRGILADVAQRSDAQALARGEHGVPPFQLVTDVDAALGSTALASAHGSAPDEDDEGDEPAKPRDDSATN